MTADFYREKHRKYLIEMVRRWLPAAIRPLFEELLEMTNGNT